MSEHHGGPAWLILPTYNEADNLEPLVEAARAKLPPNARVLIVDNSSPDGTGEDGPRDRRRGDLAPAVVAALYFLKY